jgi:hypothetical protein
LCGDFESLHEVRFRRKKKKKVRSLGRRKKQKEEESDLEDDVKEVAVVQRDTDPMDHVMVTLADITKIEEQHALIHPLLSPIPFPLTFSVLQASLKVSS